MGRGEGELHDNEVNVSIHYTFTPDGMITGQQEGRWAYSPEKGLAIRIGEEEMQGLIPHMGQDWENEMKTILFTGLDSHGFSVWGKRVK